MTTVKRDSLAQLQSQLMLQAKFSEPFFTLTSSIGMQGSDNIKTILIIEDDPFISMDLEDIFESEGFKVLGPFAEVEPGLKILEEHRPDVAMLDYNLGSETSLPVAKKLDSQNIPYAFLSGQIKTVITDNYNRPKPVILKPFIPEKLVCVVEDLMR